VIRRATTQILRRTSSFTAGIEKYDPPTLYGRLEKKPRRPKAELIEGNESHTWSQERNHPHETNSTDSGIPTGWYVDLELLLDP
jgi:hypothetical protein